MSTRAETSVRPAKGVIAACEEEVALDILESLEVRWFVADDHPSTKAACAWFGSPGKDG